MMEQKRVALANGIELDVVDQGPRDAPALIFLHGFPDSHRTWRHQIAHLSDRFRCIAPDQRGYRGSSKPAGVENYSPDKLIGDVFLLADALGVDAIREVGPGGHFFGAQHTLARYANAFYEPIISDWRNNPQWFCTTALGEPKDRALGRRGSRAAPRYRRRIARASSLVRA